MAIEFINAPLFSNKPQTPNPYPNDPEFPTKLMLADGRTVWVSCPLPDRLSWIIDVTPDVYAEWVAPDMPPEIFANGLYDYFASPGANLDIHPNSKGKLAPKDDPNAKSWSEISLALGNRDSTVWMEHKRKKKNVTVRIELNPRKLGMQGMLQLAKGLGGPTSPLSLPAVVSSARLTSVDVCVDIVGVEVTEIVLWHKDQGKRSYWSGADGRLETIYIHRKQLPLTEPPLPWKPKRSPPSLLARAYDRIREREAVLKTPPFGQVPITRIEVRKRLNGRKLAAIGDIPNPFAKLRVGFWHSQTSNKRRAWRRFCAMRRSLTFDECCEQLGLFPADRAAFIVADTVPVSDLIMSEAIWKQWSTGLEITGFQALLCN